MRHKGGEGGQYKLQFNSFVSRRLISKRNVSLVLRCVSVE